MSNAGRSQSKRSRQSNDCTVRALAIVTGIPYDEAYDFLAKEGRKCRRGFHLQKYLDKACKSDKKVLGYQIKKHSFPAQKGIERMYVGAFCLLYPEGKFITRQAKHVAAVINGNVYDLSRGVNMSNFVVLKKEQFESYLPNGFELIENPYSKEYIYQGTTKNINVGIRIFSSVDIRTDKTRDEGKDAVRVIFWDIVNDRPLGKGKRIYRVEGKTTIGERIQDRINHFMAEAYNQEVIDFGYVKAVLNSSAVNWMGFAQSLLKNLEDFGSLSEKQLNYIIGNKKLPEGKNPKGKPTMEAQAKKKDPEFLQKYLDSLEEERENENIEIENFEATSETNVPEEAEKFEEIEKGPVENVDINKLTKTSKYKPHKYPFPNFNPVQSKVLNHIEENKNMIIGANTSAGKTVCAELIMDYVLENGI